MSSSESEDEDLERLKAAVAPDFPIGTTILPASTNLTNSLTTPQTNGELKLGSRPRVSSVHTPRANTVVQSDKPSLRPEKQKQLNAADALDLDGFTPQFKDHISKKLRVKLEAGIAAEADGFVEHFESGRSGGMVSTCTSMEVEDEEEERDNDLQISIFSISARNSFQKPSNDSIKTTDNGSRKRKNRKISLGENLKQIHLTKKVKAVRAVVRTEAESRGELIQDHLGLTDDDDDDDSGKGEEEEKRLSSMAVSGQTILSASAIPIHGPKSDGAPRKKKKKRKKKTGNEDVGGVLKEPIKEEQKNQSPEPNTVPHSEPTCKKYRRKKKGKQERLKARLRLELEKDVAVSIEKGVEGK